MAFTWRCTCGIRWTLQFFCIATGSLAVAWPQTNIAPTISRITDMTTISGTPLRFEFTVSDRDTALTNLSARAESSNEAVISSTNLLLLDRSNYVSRLESNLVPFTVIPNHKAFGASTITVTVRDDADESAVSSNFRVVVQPIETHLILDYIPDQTIPPGHKLLINFFVRYEIVDDPLWVGAESSDQTVVKNEDILIIPETAPEGVRTMQITTQRNRIGTATITVFGIAPDGISSARAFTVTSAPALSTLIDGNQLIIEIDGSPHLVCALEKSSNLKEWEKTSEVTLDETGRQTFQIGILGEISDKEFFRIRAR